MRFCASAAAISLVLFGLVWIYVVFVPMAFSFAGYPIWLAKRAMLGTCDLGDLAVFGDSLAESGIVPAALPVAASNLALDATSPIETYFILARMGRCVGRLPRAVVLSLAIPSFTRVAPYLWDNAILSGVLSAEDLAAVERAAAKLGDDSVRDRPADFGLNGWTRDLVYDARFPSLYSSSLIQGGLFLRYFANYAVLADVTSARGYVPHETVQTGSGKGIGPEAGMSDFQALPIQDHYFDRMLALLSQLGLPVYYVALPLSEQTLKRTRPEIAERFATYLHRYTEKYDNLHIIDDRPAAWPEDFFIDQYHLTPRGAQRLSNILGRCFSQWAKGSDQAVGPCDLDWKAGQ